MFMIVAECSIVKQQYKVRGRVKDSKYFFFLLPVTMLVSPTIIILYSYTNMLIDHLSENTIIPLKMTIVIAIINYYDNLI